MSLYSRRTSAEKISPGESLFLAQGLLSGSEKTVALTIDELVLQKRIYEEDQPLEVIAYCMGLIVWPGKDRRTCEERTCTAKMTLARKDRSTHD